MLNLAFVAGLSDKKLAQKLAPLQALPEISKIDLYRRHSFSGDKVCWMKIPNLCSHFVPLGDFWRLMTLIKNAHRYDILIGCHQQYHGVYSALAGVLSKKRVIQLTITEPELIQKKLLGSWALRRSSAIAFRGHTTLEAFKNKYGDNKVFFIPQNVCFLSKKPIQREKSIDLLFVGYLAEAKNIPAWLQTAAAVKRQRGRLRAVLVGDKPDRHILSLVDSLGLKNDIEFTGPLYGIDLDEYYAAARVFLLTSFREGLPMVAVESMNFGVPVVATNVGDIRDLVEDGRNGYLTDIGDIDGASRAIVKLLNNEGLYQRMSANAFKRAKEFLHECTIEHVSRIWRNVFIELGLIRCSE